MSELTIHSDVAWQIASQYSYTLASDTRGLAGQIDRAIQAAVLAERERCAKIAGSMSISVDGTPYSVGGRSIAAAIREDTQ